MSPGKVPQEGEISEDRARDITSRRICRCGQSAVLTTYAGNRVWVASCPTVAHGEKNDYGHLFEDFATTPFVIGSRWEPTR
jgi:hypothetical protein